jgi:hypothetical protein
MRLPDRGVDVAVRQACEADLAVRIVAAEVHEPVVVDAEHLLRRIVVVEPGGGAEDAEDDLRLHAVELHVFQPQMRIGRTPDPFVAVRIEPDGGHLVDAVVLPGHELLARRAHAADETE